MEQKKLYIGIKLYYSNVCNSSNPFFKRGGNYSNSSGNAGVFYTNYDNGSANSNYGFRVALCPCTSIHIRSKTSVPDGYLFKESAESVFKKIKKQLDCIKEA